MSDTTMQGDLMWRGGCSFTDKVRRAQQAGAAACIVVQSAAVWPFTMSDTTMQGGDIEIPSLMLRGEDGETLRTAILYAAHVGGGGGGGGGGSGGGGVQGGGSGKAHLAEEAVTGVG